MLTTMERYAAYVIFMLFQSMQSYNITGLSPYQEINVTITATNGGGTSQPSDGVSGRSSEDGIAYSLKDNHLMYYILLTHSSWSSRSD